MTTKTRAQKGGEIGMNGEFYKGGQFLPSTTLPKRAAQQKLSKSKKQEIANYKWEVAPKDSYRSIFTMIAGIFVKWEIRNEKFEFSASQQTLDYLKTTKEEVIILMNAWNNGARWIDTDTGELI
jgi:hypothetical protein